MKAIMSVVTAAAIVGGMMVRTQAQSMGGVVQSAKDAQWGAARSMLGFTEEVDVDERQEHSAGQ